jgi:hypothetical protein
VDGEKSKFAEINFNKISSNYRVLYLSLLFRSTFIQKLFFKFICRFNHNTMAKNKTTETESSVSDFINTIADETKRNDSFRLVELMEGITGYPVKMWGAAIIGFGSGHYKYASGHEGDVPLAAFSPRKAAISLYLSQNFPGRAELLSKFGKHKTGKGCIYVNKLADIDMDVLKQMITVSVDHYKRTGQPC